MDQIPAALYAVLKADNPMTVRQVFYQAVSRGIIAKTEGEYKQTIVRLLTEMRRAREIPFGWIADNTRWMRKPDTFTSLEAALLLTAATYRRALWHEQRVYVEVWLEKDALSGVLHPVTANWDVPLMVTRGYPSITYLHSAAEAISAQRKPAYIYYFGDHDPSGIDIPRKVEAGLREFAPEAEIHFERIAVLPEQIQELHLPTRPTKQSDSRSKHFAGESVEVDAIPPARLRGMVEDCIFPHIDEHALHVMHVAEQSERKILQRLADVMTKEESEDEGDPGTGQ
jgi:hypothetical protein